MREPHDACPDVASAFFLGVAAFFAPDFFAGAFLEPSVLVVFVTRPDLVVLRTVAFSVTAGACIGVSGYTDGYHPCGNVQ